MGVPWYVWYMIEIYIIHTYMGASSHDAVYWGNVLKFTDVIKYEFNESQYVP